MDVDTVEVNECKTSTCAPLHEASDSNIAAEASPPMPASSSPHTEQPTPVDMETPPDKELSDEGEMDDEENTGKLASQCASNNAAGDQRVNGRYKEMTLV
jgi:hypothetical protein